MYLPIALFFPIMPRNRGWDGDCIGDAGQAHRLSWDLSHRPISGGTRGPRTISEVQRIHGEPAGNVLPDALPHREKVLVSQGLGRRTDVC